jgi:hypothetical protein
MIAHVSIPSADPQATALLFSALIDGQAFTFPVVPGAWIAVARDGSGTAVEVYPVGIAHHPGVGEADPLLVPEEPAQMPWEDQIISDGDPMRPSAFHIAIVTGLDDEQIFALAREAGIRAIRCERGGVFGLIELWIDNMTLVEVLTSVDAARYRDFMNPAQCTVMFGPGSAPALAA